MYMKCQGKEGLLKPSAHRAICLLMNMWCLVLGGFLFAHSLFADQQEDEAKLYFHNLSVEERVESLSKSRSLNLNWNESDVKVSILDWLNNKCSKFGVYSKDGQGQFKRPAIPCDYVPALGDEKLDGMTEKFLCKFNIGNKTKVLKVKYGKFDSMSKETTNGPLGTTFANLMGFAADVLCPALISCRGCPSQNPWSSHRSSDPKSDKTYNFKIAVIENKWKGIKITNPGTPKKPQGFAWDEVSRIDSQLPKDQKEAVLAEREALMLWHVFIINTDADAHNNRLVCDEYTKTNEKYHCEKVTAYSHDYGDSFGRANLKSFNVSVFKNDLPGSCIGNLNNGEGVIVKPRISEEARKFLYERLSLLSTDQIRDLFALVSIADAQWFGVFTNTQDWVNAFLKKRLELGQKRCEPISSGKTVLGAGLR